MADIIKKATDRAYDIGYEVGSNHAQWVQQDTFGGRVSHKEAIRNARALDKAIEDGDPVLWEGMPNLSGEWAGSTTPTSLCSDLKEEFETSEEQDDEIDQAQDDISEAWETGVMDGYIVTLEGLIRSCLSDCSDQ